MINVKKGQVFSKSHAVKIDVIMGPANIIFTMRYFIYNI